MFWFGTSISYLSGPIIGGVVAAHYGDPAAFYLGAAFSLLAIPVVITVTRPGRPPSDVTAAGAPNVLGDPAILKLCLFNRLSYTLTRTWWTFLPVSHAPPG